MGHPIVRSLDMTLREFMIYLGENPFQVLAAQRDPYPVMEEAGLSSEDQALLTSGDAERILAALVEENP